MTGPTVAQVMTEMAQRQIEVATLLLQRPEPGMREAVYALEQSGALRALPWWCNCQACWACVAAASHVTGLIRILSGQISPPEPPAQIWQRFMAERFRQENP